MYHLYVFIVKGSLSLDESKAFFMFGATYRKKHYLFNVSLSSVFLLNQLFLFQLHCEIHKNEVKSAIQPQIVNMAKISANEQFLIVGY